MDGEEVAMAAFHALPSGAIVFGAPAAQALTADFATGAGSCLLEIHSQEPTTVGKGGEELNRKQRSGSKNLLAYLVQEQPVPRGEAP